MKIINPSTEEVIGNVKEFSSEDIQSIYLELINGQKIWNDTSLDDRIAIIQKFGELVKESIDELATLLTSEMGKPVNQAKNEINGAHGRIEYFLNNIKKWLAEEWTVTEGATKEKIVYEPLGIIANISAWNYPYNVGYNVFIPALLSGNAVFYKPSEYTSLTGLKIAELLYKAGVPENVFKTVTGGKATGEALLKLPLQGYYFTGSYLTGQKIASEIAPKMVPLQMELGGKDPLYVADDVKDIAFSAAQAVEGKFYNSGQSCCAVERIYVHEKIYDAFVKAFVKETEMLRVGDPTREDTDMGPVARKEQLNFLLFQVNDALDKGAKLLTGDESLESKGYFFEPTVLTDVNHDMSLMVDETFGPLVGIQKVESDEEAIALMNETSYGLTAAVFSSDEERASNILSKVNAGTTYWNCCDRVSPTSPWSGRKNSGIGSTLSYQGIRAFVQPKAYHLREL
ncbi:aldehyde dehydrogenase family protein [Chondrinema litorale]|uniref:aldehyde dehydrogenase family protein n=1 Tax=Chondrinema litorale TaxID=2994555 RepID=UPI002543C0B2|nr:aldehyde dehydrogenase family protein [Chondrinema litorale]UZR93303.1 aldehyde dehydrogenase family protein [Chondrinema litorale]